MITKTEHIIWSVVALSAIGYQVFSGLIIFGVIG